MYYIVNFGSTKTPKIKSCIEECGETAEIFDWQTVHVRPEDLKGIIFSGSPTFLTVVDHAPYHEKIMPLLSWNVPVLGICFGHQVLGILHGAKIYRGDEVRRAEKINLMSSTPLFRNLGNPAEMTEDHTEGINVPADFIHCASSQTYVNEGMMHSEKPFYGVQFHPEVSGDAGKILFSNFIEICKNH
jgi:GMP synthase (glutamine-hydrolysing)